MTQARLSALPQQGVAPSQEIRAMIAQGKIRSRHPIAEAQIQPASLDLRLGKRAWRIRASFLTGAHETVAERMSEFVMHEIDLTQGAVLETGCIYLAELQESLALSSEYDAVANAKSSTGRLDLFTRLITDYGSNFDRVGAGYQGPLYAEISPRAFSVLARTGTRLNQIRFRIGECGLADTALQALHTQIPLVDGHAKFSDGLAFSVDLLPKENHAVGYKSRHHAPLIDLDQINTYAPAEFWEPLHTTAKGRLILDPGAFYILASQESVCVPDDYAAEMQPYAAMIGEFRVHYAGFFDPGFGAAAHGGKARGVLEVRCHEVPFALEHGQIAGRLSYEPMRSRPDKLYGDSLGSNYTGQGLKLSKHFKNN